ncbi:MAG: bifunctional metallophosphatase/5'-nucleotidase [Curvibacter sp.]|nr:bifunctional metallophosphatase/5'-nucleotidase [Curvibacter sp.]
MGFVRQLGAAAVVAAVGLLTACGGSSGSQPPGPVRLIAFNDIHGYLSTTDNNSTSIVQVPGNAAGVKVNTGGLAYMSTLISQLKAANPSSIVVAAGDNIGASPYTSNIAHDEPTVDILNQLGLEVSSVGNHEFDKGLTELKRIQGSNGASTCYPSDGTFGVVGKDTCLMTGNTFSGAKWTYLAANVVNSSTGQTIFPATYVKTFPGSGSYGNTTVGFIGLTFKNTPSEVNQTGVAGLSFGDEATAINNAARSLKVQGVNAVVVLIHQGGYTTSTYYGDTTCPGFNGDLLPIVDALSADVDVVVSGHTHTDYICQRNGKLVTQSGFYGTGVTSIDLSFDGSGHMASAQAVNNPVINDTNTTAYPSGITALSKNATVDSAISRYVQLSAAAGSAIVGTIANQVTIQAPPAGCSTNNTCDSGSRNKTVESAMGDLSADSQLAAFQGSSITNPGQISFIQAGGVRTNLGTSTGPYPNYPVSYAQLFATNPFHDTLVAIDMTGAQIKRVLEQQWEAPNNTAFYAPGGVGEILNPSVGFSYTWDSSQPAGMPSGQGNRVVASSMMLNGTLMSQTQTYRVVVSTFLQGGGDNFSVFKQGLNPIQGGFDIAALVNYMTAHPNYQPVTPSRITKLGTNP